MNLNRVLIVGHLTRSPEVRTAQNGTVVARFGVATNSAWTDESGEKREEVEFHNVVAFGRQAETAGEYLRKGQLVLVEGRLRTSSWTTEGVKSSRTDIIAARIQFGQKRPEPSRDTDDLPEENTAPADITEDPHDEIPF
jgi:single-strand DNA-binding protein